MRTINFETSQNVLIEYELAGLSDRVLAATIDSAILLAYYIIYITILVSTIQGASIVEEGFYIMYIILLLPALFYHLICEIFFQGQSIGKRQMGIKVAKGDGGSVSIGAYLIRWVMRLVEIAMFFGSLALLFIIISPMGQRLGDLMAGTVVIKVGKKEKLTFLKVPKEPPADYRVSFPQVAVLRDTELELVRESLKRNRDLGVVKPVLAAEKKIKELLNIDTDLPPVKFLHVVLADHNYLAYQQWQNEQV